MTEAEKSITVGTKVLILDTLPNVMKTLGFTDDTVESMRVLVHKKMKVLSIWFDDDSDTWYGTVDLCTEIPLQCLRKV